MYRSGFIEESVLSLDHYCHTRIVKLWLQGYVYTDVYAGWIGFYGIWQTHYYIQILGFLYGTDNVIIKTIKPQLKCNMWLPHIPNYVENTFNICINKPHCVSGRCDSHMWYLLGVNCSSVLPHAEHWCRAKTNSTIKKKPTGRRPVSSTVDFVIAKRYARIPPPRDSDQKKHFHIRMPS